MAENDFFKKIGQFYEDKIAVFWKLVHNEHMHTGYWDEKNLVSGLAEGAVRLTEVMIEHAMIKEGQHFIDIGSGYGLPGILLSQKKGCRLKGVTASQQQCDVSNAKAKESQLSDQVEFAVNNANELVFDSNSFDGGWFFESIFHIGHESALKECFRVLKPGSHLLISDFTVSNSIPESEMEYLKKTFKVKSLKSLDEYETMMSNAGFANIEIEDVTDKTISKRTGKYNQALEFYKDAIVNDIGLDDYNWIKNFWFEINESIFDKYIGYIIVKCVKQND